MKKRVLIVGQCEPDGLAIASLLETTFRADVESAATADEAMSSLHNSPFDLVLVNRIFDADGESGIELISAIRADSGISKIPMMLVSNYPECQEQAVNAGALPGFGKAQLAANETPECLRPLFDDM